MKDIMTTLRCGSRWVMGCALTLSLVVAFTGAQAQEMKPAKAAGAAAKTAYYFDPAVLNVGALIAEPPATGSAEDKAELAELHRSARTRTAAQVAAAKADEANEDMFLYETVLGPGFNAEALPVTAELGVHVKNEQSVAGSALKAVFHRVRPYNEDKTLHPACAMTDVPNSYPSGHALTGYMEGLTLAELLPERRDAILARADEFAHNRLVCGVHHASDIEASRKVAYVVFGYMMATPKFQHDLAAAKAELTAKLGAAANAR
jgi:acid phosphatase (class A)